MIHCGGKRRSYAMFKTLNIRRMWYVYWAAAALDLKQCGFISHSTVHYRGLFVRGHMIYIVPRRSRGQYSCVRGQIIPYSVQ